MTCFGLIFSIENDFGAILTELGSDTQKYTKIVGAKSVKSAVFNGSSIDFQTSSDVVGPHPSNIGSVEDGVNRVCPQSKYQQKTSLRI